MMTSLFESKRPTRASLAPTVISIALHASIATAVVILTPLFETATRAVLDVAAVVPLVAPRETLRPSHLPSPRQYTKTDAVPTSNSPERTSALYHASVVIGGLDPVTSHRATRVRDVQIVIGQLDSLPGAGENAQPLGTDGSSDMFSLAVRQPTSGVTTTSGGMRARLLSAPNPSYTEEAKQRGITGNVILEVDLLTSGDVHVLRVISGLGHGLDQAAIDAVNHMRCVPAVSRSGQPVTVTATITVVFRLT